MTINEAIEHYEDIVESLKQQFDQCDIDDRFENHIRVESSKHISEYEQLIKWLKELKDFRTLYIESIIKGTPTVIHKDRKIYNVESSVKDFIQKLDTIKDAINHIEDYIKQNKDIIELINLCLCGGYNKLCFCGGYNNTFEIEYYINLIKQNCEHN